MKKKIYKQPVVKVCEVDVTSLVCVSPPDYNGPLGAKERSMEELDELEYVYDDLFK